MGGGQLGYWIAAIMPPLAQATSVACSLHPQDYNSKAVCYKWPIASNSLRLPGAYSGFSEGGGTPRSQALVRGRREPGNEANPDRESY